MSNKLTWTKLFFWLLKRKIFPISISYNSNLVIFNDFLPNWKGHSRSIFSHIIQPIIRDFDLSLKAKGTFQIKYIIRFYMNMILLLHTVEPLKSKVIYDRKWKNINFFLEMELAWFFFSKSICTMHFFTDYQNRLFIVKGSTKYRLKF